MNSESISLHYSFLAYIYCSIHGICYSPRLHIDICNRTPITVSYMHEEKKIMCIDFYKL